MVVLSFCLFIEKELNIGWVSQKQGEDSEALRGRTNMIKNVPKYKKTVLNNKNIIQRKIKLKRYEAMLVSRQIVLTSSVEKLPPYLTVRTTSQCYLINLLSVSIRSF